MTVACYADPRPGEDAFGQGSKNGLCGTHGGCSGEVMDGETKKSWRQISNRVPGYRKLKGTWVAN